MLAARRQAASYLMTREAVSKLFDTISPRYGDRDGGYLRIIRGGLRQGDGGELAFVELLGSEKTLDEKRQKRAEETRKAMEAAEAENKQVAEEPAAPEEKKE
jgi:large subunit ribosomal protein L17